jgi:hypothetical protein
MRRFLHAALILLLAAVVPTVAIAQVCGGMEMPCCTKRSSDAASLARPGCCAAPCFEKAPDHRESASETRQVRLSLPDAAGTTLDGATPLGAPAVEQPADPAVSPPVSRRLASLSILLI